jgi:hypothetical protein
LNAAALHPTLDLVAGAPKSAGNNATVHYLPHTTGWTTKFDGLQTALWNPVIQTGDGSFGVQTNYFGFNITATNRVTVAVEACTNLASPVWTPLQSVTLSSSCFYFSEPVQANGAGRFYGLGFP